MRKTIRVKFSAGQGLARGGVTSLRRFVKDEYMKKTFILAVADRTAMVRLFMDAFRKCKADDFHTARVIRQFLKRFYLSRAEIHAILFHIGFRYSTKKSAADRATSNPVLRNIRINAYHNHHNHKKTRKT